MIYIKFLLTLFLGTALIYLLSACCNDKIQYNKYPNLLKNTDNKPTNKLAFASVILLYTAVVFFINGNLQDFYVDYDSMSVQLESLINRSIRFQIWDGRFFPLSHVDNSVIFILFKSFTAIKIYLALHLLLLLVVAYFALDFLSGNKRLCLLALLLVCPPVINAYSSPIYSERNVILLLFASLWFFRQALQSGKTMHQKLFLFAAVISCYLSLFFKETIVTYLASFAVLSLSLRAFRESHNLRGFAEGLKKRVLSIELLIMAACFFWVISFFASGGDYSPNYVEKKQSIALQTALENNALEIALWSLFGLFLVWHKKLNIYTVLFLSTVPMMLYSNLVFKSQGAYNIYPYLNSLFYVFVVVFAVSYKGKSFYNYSIVVGSLFLILSIQGFSQFTTEVQNRSAVLQKVQSLADGESHKVTVDLQSDWRERNLARYLLYKADELTVVHSGDNRIFCQDKVLYSAKKQCVTSDSVSSNYLLTDKDNITGAEIIIKTEELSLYKY